MRVFEETQRFNQWWLYALLIFLLLGPFLKFYEQFLREDYQEIFWYGLIFIGFIFITGAILLLRLRTRIDNRGIEVVFYPLNFTKKKFSWEDIDDVYVRQYSPLSEYGGWGLRSRGSKKAYNVSGNYGIQIVARDKKSFLIGTRKPELAKAFLKRMKEKKEDQNF